MFIFGIKDRSFSRAREPLICDILEVAAESAKPVALLDAHSSTSLLCYHPNVHECHRMVRIGTHLSPPSQDVPALEFLHSQALAEAHQVAFGGLGVVWWSQPGPIDFIDNSTPQQLRGVIFLFIVFLGSDKMTPRKQVLMALSESVGVAVEYSGTRSRSQLGRRSSEAIVSRYRI